MSANDATLDLDAAARFIGETPKEVERLARIGAVPRHNGRFNPIMLVRGYAEYIRGEAKRRNDSPTQVEIGAHLDMSDRNVRELLQRLGLDAQSVTLDEVRIAYIRDLREKAAGRSGEEQYSLTRARTREAQASADLKLLQIAERTRELVPVSEVEPQLMAMVAAARTELLVLPSVLAQELRALHGIEVDPAIIEDRINDALCHLATKLQHDVGGDDDPSGEGVGAAA